LPDVISSVDEKSLVQRFEKLPLKPFGFHGHQGNRRIYTFGHRYVFAGQEPHADASICDYLLPLTDVDWAFRINFRRARASEEILVTPSELRIRRVSHRGHVAEWVLNPLWVRIDQVGHEEFGIGFQGSQGFGRQLSEPRRKSKFFQRLEGGPRRRPARRDLQPP
jgi:integral membrane protein DUF2244